MLVITLTAATDHRKSLRFVRTHMVQACPHYQRDNFQMRIDELEGLNEQTKIRVLITPGNRRSLDPVRAKVTKTSDECESGRECNCAARELPRNPMKPLLRAVQSSAGDVRN